MACFRSFYFCTAIHGSGFCLLFLMDIFVQNESLEDSGRFRERGGRIPGDANGSLANREGYGQENQLWGAKGWYLRQQGNTQLGSDQSGYGEYICPFKDNIRSNASQIKELIC